MQWTLARCGSLWAALAIGLALVACSSSSSGAPTAVAGASATGAPATPPSNVAASWALVNGTQQTAISQDGIVQQIQAGNIGPTAQIIKVGRLGATAIANWPEFQQYFPVDTLPQSFRQEYYFDFPDGNTAILTLRNLAPLVDDGYLKLTRDTKIRGGPISGYVTASSWEPIYFLLPR